MKLPLIANGEVWTVADWHAIRAASGCDDVMLGRGAVADPLLARRIRGNAEAEPNDGDWREIETMLAKFWERVERKVLPAQSPGRLKQWLGLMQRRYPRAEHLFRTLRTAKRGPDVAALLACEGIVGAERSAV